jgi:hypothetical protein
VSRGDVRMMGIAMKKRVLDKEKSFG